MRDSCGGIYTRQGWLILLLFCLVMGCSAQAAPVSDVRSTKHNLSMSGVGTTRASSETEVCVFCHTPHAATEGVSPLWNRELSGATYKRYTSASMSVDALGYSEDDPAGSSLLCLSCHDGQVALGNVNVLRGTANPTIDMDGTTGDRMPDGYGTNSGNTTNLGTDLTNDHPIAISYTNDVAVHDAELQGLNAQQQNLPVNGFAEGELIGIREVGVSPKPLFPLEPTGTTPGLEGQIQCASCHDPHLYDPEDEQRKFLRMNRLQQNAPPSPAGYNPDNDIMCLACHTKSYSSWAMSAHANSDIADEAFTAEAAAAMDFPPGTKVWQASCLNCHDMHTVQGSRRLLREGVLEDGNMTTIIRPGFEANDALDPDGNRYAAIETTCFQCHRNADDPLNILEPAAGSLVPSTKSLFDLPYGMPVSSPDQPYDFTNSYPRERHEILNADMTETPTSLGRDDLPGEDPGYRRHAECTDCHNPHRVRRSRTFWEEPLTNDQTDEGTKIRTHRPGGPVGNIASGVLRGAWGVEPTFEFEAGKWPSFPQSFTVKKGDPETVSGYPIGRQGTIAASNLTREYQLCFKCHSNYSIGPSPETATPEDFPSLGYTAQGCITTEERQGRCTPVSMANGLTRYTNIAAEFGSVVATDPPTTGTDQGEYSNDTSNRGTACVSASVPGVPDAPTNLTDGNWTDRNVDPWANQLGDCQPRDSSAEFPAHGTGSLRNNHRSWHPVVFPTGRDRGERRMGTGSINLLPPFRDNIGRNTMHCSDCHGQASSWLAGNEDGTGGAIDTEVQGPHGSTNPFLLRGVWDVTITLIDYDEGRNDDTRSLCTNCHTPRALTGARRNGNATGFTGDGLSNDHMGDGDMNLLPCLNCHIAVPHGWKNKAFLANLRCVGSEVGRTANWWSASQVSTPGECDSYGVYDDENNFDRVFLVEPPYYYNAGFRVTNWRRSGDWNKASCGGSAMEKCRW